MAIEMKRIGARPIRAAGYDARERILRVEFDNGKTLEYVAVGEEIARRFLSSASPASIWRDTIEEEFTAREVRDPPGNGSSEAARKALEALFG